MKGSVNNQVNQLWHQVDGIGESKAANRSSSSYKGHNGHNVSDKVHSFKLKDEFIRVSKELAQFAKSNYNIKDLQAISKVVVDDFIHQKIDKGLYRKTISTYISLLSKIQLGLSKLPKKIEKHQELFTQKDLENMRKIVDISTVNSPHKNRAYINPKSLINYVPEESKICFQLQLMYGLRAKEANLIRPHQLKEDNIIEIQGKGGFLRSIRLSLKLYNALKKEIKRNGSYYRDYYSYLKDLKDAVERSGEKWTGTHGLRYNFAQTQVEEFKSEMPYEEALLKVSSELGHKRKEITNHYLG